MSICLASRSLGWLVALAIPVVALAQSGDDGSPGQSGGPRGLPKVRVDRWDLIAPFDGVIDRSTVTYYTYSPNGLLVHERIDGDAGNNGSIDSVTETSYAYDDLKNRIYRDMQFDAGADGSFTQSEHEEWTYDAGSHLMTRTFTVQDVIDTEVYTRDSEGRPLTRAASFEQFGQKSVSFDTYTAWEDHGLPTAWSSVTDNFVSDGAGGWNPTGSISSSVSSATYDLEGLQLSETTSLDTGRDGSVNQITTKSFTRDARGNELVFIQERDNLADGSINFRRTRNSTYDHRDGRTRYDDFTDNNGDGVNTNGDFGFDSATTNNKWGNPVSSLQQNWRNRFGVIEQRQRFEIEWTY